MDLDQVPSLWRNKPVESIIANLGELVKNHFIALWTPAEFTFLEHIIIEN